MVVMVVEEVLLLRTVSRVKQVPERVVQGESVDRGDRGEIPADPGQVVVMDLQGQTVPLEHQLPR